MKPRISFIDPRRFRLIQQSLDGTFLMNSAIYTSQRKHDELAAAVTGDGFGSASPTRVPEFRRGFGRSFEKSTQPMSPKGGFGLGLAVAEAFVELHGGRISARIVPREALRFRSCFQSEKRRFSPGGAEVEFRLRRILLLKTPSPQSKVFEDRPGGHEDFPWRRPPPGA